MGYRSLEEAITRGKGRERAFRCPVHGDRTASASVNVAKGWWYCYVCGAKGTTEQIIESEGYEFLAMVEELLDEEPRTYTEAWLDQFTHEPGAYWSERGFSDAAIKHFRLGMEWSTNRPCYPMRASDGTVLGVVYRNLSDEGPKYRYPSGVRKSNLLFNYTPQLATTVVLTEGALDAIAVWEAGYPRAMGIYGAILSDAQINLLQRIEPHRIILALDNDDAGRRSTFGWRKDDGSYVMGALERLEMAGFEAVSVEWDSRPVKDIAECSLTLRKTLLDSLAL